MATVCGGVLALMDAGVPIKAPVAGVAMGLVKEGEKYAILTDIAGAEDHYGDMDFTVAGTERGITGLQMDIKVGGITRAVMAEALAQAREGRLSILQKMAEALASPRPPRPRRRTTPFASRSRAGSATTPTARASASRTTQSMRSPPRSPPPRARRRAAPRSPRDWR